MAAEPQPASQSHPSSKLQALRHSRLMSHTANGVAPPSFLVLQVSSLSLSFRSLHTPSAHAESLSNLCTTPHHAVHKADETAGGEKAPIKQAPKNPPTNTHPPPRRPLRHTHAPPCRHALSSSQLGTPPGELTAEPCRSVFQAAMRNVFETKEPPQRRNDGLIMISP